jgi:HD-GYP domain-containing protein (c-di-GMP phosphodiesterase class II)
MGSRLAGRADKHFVAIVDASATHRSQIAAALLSFYKVTDYQDAAHALAAFQSVLPALVLVGESVPPGSGYDFVRRLRDEPDLIDVPVVMVVGKDDPSNRIAVVRCGANDHLVKPYRRSALIRTISNLLNRDVERRWDALPPLQHDALKGTVEVFNSISDVIDKGEPIAYQTVSDACSPLVEAVNKSDFKGILLGVRDHDNYSYAHSMRVATLLSLFGFTIRLPPGEQVILASGGLLHDVGKMSIPHEVLNKPGRLTPEEFGVMKGHVTASADYLRCCPDIPKGIITIAEQHHEKLDGTGYPHGLAGSQLNELARMASIVDVFSALTDRRVYRPPMDAEKALGIMVDEMGRHLDQGLLALFRQMLLDAAVDVSSVH